MQDDEKQEKLIQELHVVLILMKSIRIYYTYITQTFAGNKFLRFGTWKWVKQTNNYRDFTSDK